MWSRTRCPSWAAAAPIRWRPHERIPATMARVGGIASVASLLLVAGVTSAFQWQASTEEARSLEFRTGSVRRDVEFMEISTRKAQQLAAETEALRAKVALVETILPASLGLAEFRPA